MGNSVRLGNCPKWAFALARPFFSICVVGKALRDEFRWREKAIAGIDASLKERKGDPVKAELDIAMKRIGELIMQVELLEAKTETSGPLGRRRSRR